LIARHCLPRPPGFSQNIAKVVEAACIARFDSKNLAIKQFSLGEAAAVLVAGRRMKQVGGRGLPALLGSCAALSSVHPVAAAGLKIEVEWGQAGPPIWSPSNNGVFTARRKLCPVSPQAPLPRTSRRDRAVCCSPPGGPRA